MKNQKQNKKLERKKEKKIAIYQILIIIILLSLVIMDALFSTDNSYIASLIRSLFKK